MVDVEVRDMAAAEQMFEGILEKEDEKTRAEAIELFLKHFKRSYDSIKKSSSNIQQPDVDIHRFIRGAVEFILVWAQDENQPTESNIPILKKAECYGIGLAHLMGSVEFYLLPFLDAFSPEVPNSKILEPLLKMFTSANLGLKKHFKPKDSIVIQKRIIALTDKQPLTAGQKEIIRGIAAIFA